jgi:hypothetical protein
LFQCPAKTLIFCRRLGGSLPELLPEAIDADAKARKFRGDKIVVGRAARTVNLVAARSSPRIEVVLPLTVRSHRDTTLKNKEQVKATDEKR